MRRLLSPTAFLAAALALAGAAQAQPVIQRSTAKPPPLPFNLPANVTTGRLAVVGQGDAVQPPGPERQTYTPPPPPFSLPANVTTGRLSVVGLGGQSGTR